MPGRTNPWIGVLAAGVAAVLAGCGGGGASTSTTARTGPGAGRPPVVIGSQDFTEQRILGELYAQALRAKAFRVRLKPDLPNRLAAAGALVDGQVDGYLEYIRAILQTVAHDARPPAHAEAAYGAVRAFEGRRGFVALAPTPFARTDALATTAAFARAHDLRDLGGLARAGPVRLGAPPNFDVRPIAGLPSLRRTYGMTGLRFVPLSQGIQYAALDRGQVQVAVVMTSDARLRSGRYVVLADPRGAFGVGNLVPVFSRAVLAAEGPAFTQTIEAVSAKLTTNAMRRLNAAVELDKRAPADVARDFLKSSGLA